MTLRKVEIYSRFERFWHWTQMILILALIISGFAIHGFYQLASFEIADRIHTFSAMGLILLWISIVLWLLTTGAWQQFMPTRQGLWAVMRFYSYGIFKGEHHPYRKAFHRKLNPLQALTYFALKLILFPLIWLSGLAYLLYGVWGKFVSTSVPLTTVALIHTGAAFAVVIFISIHVYMLTTGDSFVDHLAPMITGFDEIELTPPEEAYLEADEPERLS